MVPPFEAFFLKGSFCIHHPPAGGVARGAVLYVPPFAEEMNKSRRMAALQSRAFARAGLAVLQVDPRGTGDSEGDFGDFGWTDWLADIGHAADWLRHRWPVPLTLWGLRSGCLLATAAAPGLSEPCDFLFWQPTPSGRTVLQQFLRLKLAGAMLAGGERAGTKELRAQLARGEPLEVAGYRLRPELAEGLEGATLLPPASPCRVDWLEVSGSADDGLSPAFEIAREKWDAAGHVLRGRACVGPAFWQTTEIEDAPALIEATLATLPTTVPA